MDPAAPPVSAPALVNDEAAALAIKVSRKNRRLGGAYVPPHLRDGASREVNPADIPPSPPSKPTYQTTSGQSLQGLMFEGSSRTFGGTDSASRTANSGRGGRFARDPRDAPLRRRGQNHLYNGARGGSTNGARGGHYVPHMRHVPRGYQQGQRSAARSQPLRREGFDHRHGVDAYEEEDDVEEEEEEAAERGRRPRRGAEDPGWDRSHWSPQRRHVPAEGHTGRERRHMNERRRRERGRGRGQGRGQGEQRGAPHSYAQEEPMAPMSLPQQARAQVAHEDPRSFAHAHDTRPPLRGAPHMDASRRAAEPPPVEEPTAGATSGQPRAPRRRKAPRGSAQPRARDKQATNALVITESFQQRSPERPQEVSVTKQRSQRSHNPLEAPTNYAAAIKGSPGQQAQDYQQVMQAAVQGVMSLNVDPRNVGMAGNARGAAQQALQAPQRPPQQLQYQRQQPARHDVHAEVATQRSATPLAHIVIEVTGVPCSPEGVRTVTRWFSANQLEYQLVIMEQGKVLVVLPNTHESLQLVAPRGRRPKHFQFHALRDVHMIQNLLKHHHLPNINTTNPVTRRRQVTTGRQQPRGPVPNVRESNPFGTLREALAHLLQVEGLATEDAPILINTLREQYVSFGGVFAHEGVLFVDCRHPKHAREVLHSFRSSSVRLRPVDERYAALLHKVPPARRPVTDASVARRHINQHLGGGAARQATQQKRQPKPRNKQPRGRSRRERERQQQQLYKPKEETQDLQHSAFASEGPAEGIEAFCEIRSRQRYEARAAQQKWREKCDEANTSWNS